MYLTCCLHAQPILIESRTPTNTDNSVFWSYPSGTWGTSGNISRAPCTPSYKATGSRQTTDSNGPPSFLAIATNETSLSPGIAYAVQVTTPTSNTQPPPNDLVVAIGTTDVTNSTLPATTAAFSTDGTNRWVTLGEIICSNGNPTLIFTYVSGSIGSSPMRRFYAQCVRFIPQNQTNATRTWTGGAGPSDPMWNNPTNWGGTAPKLNGDDIVFDGSTNLYSVPDGPFSINSLKYLSNAGAFTIGANFSGPLTVATTNGISNFSTNDQVIFVTISQGSFPLILNTGSKILSLSNTLSGTAGYTVNGSSTLNLRSTNNNITGPVTVNTGATIRLAKHFCIGGTGIGAGDVTLEGSILRNDDTTFSAAFLISNRNIFIGPGGATLNLPASSSQNLIYDGVIRNSTGNGTLIKEGSGKLTLGGINPNTYSGPTTVNAGRLILSKSSSNAVPGDLIIPATIVQLTASDQIGDGATVTISGGLLGFSASANDTIGQLILNGGSVTGAVSTLTATKFDFRAGTNTINLAGNANLSKTTTGTVVLYGNHTYTGTTAVSNGILLVNGTIGLGTVTVMGGKLAGIGTITGPVQIESGGTLSPGQSIGQMTMTSSLTLQPGSITFAELDKATGTNDFIVGLTNLTYGGTLIVTNLAGTLTTNDIFKLFESAAYSNAFASFAMPSLNVGLTWDTSSLTVDGTIRVVEITAPPQQPHITNSVMLGTNLVISGVNGTTNGAFYVLVSSNVALPLTNWTVIATGQFGGNGQFLVTNSITIEIPQRFFILQVP